MSLKFLSLSSLFLIMFLALPVGTGDTTELIRGSNYLFSCLSSQDSSQCENLERFGFTPHLISALLFTIYPNPDVVIVLWSILNFISFLIIIYWFYIYSFSIYNVTKDSRIFFIGLTFSPIIAYGIYSFSEIVFILIAILFLHFLLRKNYYLASILGFFAFTYKDNAFLTLIPLLTVILILNKERVFKYIYFLLVVFLGIVANFYFNFLRYQSITNSTYQDFGTVLDFNFNLSNFFAVWFSPSGGVLGYFFILPFLILITFLIQYKTFSNLQRLIALLLIAPLVLLTINLSFWFSPFGWASWGPRLILPTLVLVSFTTFIFIKEKNIEFSAKWKPTSHKLFFSSSYLMFLSNLGFALNPGIWSTWLENLYEKGIACEYFPLWEQSRSDYLECKLPLVWTYDSLPINSILEVLKVLREFTFSSQLSISILAIFCSIVVALYFIINLKQNLEKST